MSKVSLAEEVAKVINQVLGGRLPHNEILIYVTPFHIQGHCSEIASSFFIALQKANSVACNTAFFFWTRTLSSIMYMYASENCHVYKNKH